MHVHTYHGISPRLLCLYNPISSTAVSTGCPSGLSLPTVGPPINVPQACDQISKDVGPENRLPNNSSVNRDNLTVRSSKILKSRISLVRPLTPTAGAETRSYRRAVWASPRVNSSAPRIWYVGRTES